MHKKHKLKIYTYITYKKLFNHMNEYCNESLELKQRTYTYCNRSKIEKPTADKDKLTNDRAK